MLSRPRVAVLLGTVAIALSGCGTSSTSTPTPSTPAPPAAGSPSTSLNPVDQAEVNRAVIKYNQATDSATNRIDASSAATNVAGTLASVATKHVGTNLSRQLTAASQAWLGLSNAILHGTSSDIEAAKGRVQTADAPLG